MAYGNKSIREYYARKAEIWIEVESTPAYLVRIYLWRLYGTTLTYRLHFVR